MDLGTRLHQSLTPMRSLASEELITMLVLLHLQVADATSSKGTWSYSSMDCPFLFLLPQHGEGTCLFLSSRLCSHMYFLLHSAASEKHNEWPALFPYSAFYMPLQYLLFAAVSWKSLCACWGCSGPKQLEHWSCLSFMSMWLGWGNH